MIEGVLSPNGDQLYVRFSEVYSSKLSIDQLSSNKGCNPTPIISIVKFCALMLTTVSILYCVVILGGPDPGLTKEGKLVALAPEKDGFEAG